MFDEYIKPSQRNNNSLFLSGRPKPTLGLAMIMKNEAQNLPYSLGPLTGLLDQIVVVDTGSTDESPQMAAGYGAKVVHRAWTNDFSEARNYGLDYLTTDYILWLDADNSLTPTDLSMIRDRLKGGNLILTATEVVVPQGDRLRQKRVFKNTPAVRFQGRIHEQLVHPADWPIIHCPAEIRHWGYADGNMAREKGHRNLQLLLSDPLTAAGDFYYLYQTGRTLFNLRFFKEARDYLNQAVSVGLVGDKSDRTENNQRFLSMENPEEVLWDYETCAKQVRQLDGAQEFDQDCSHELEVNPALWSHALILLSQVHLRLCESKEAENSLRYLILIRPDYGPGRAHLGRFLYESGRIAESIPQLMKALALGCGDPGWGADPRKIGFTAACQLAKANEHQGFFQQARKAWEEAVRLNPDNPEPYVALAESSISQGDTSKARDLLAQAIRLAPGHRRARSMEAKL